MAKYDTYVLSLNVGTTADNATLKLAVLFEDEDDIALVIREVTEKIRNEAVHMKDTKFLNDTKQ